MVTNAGGGYSRWQDLDLTRWREDAAQDDHGFFFFLREVDSGKAWSATHQPLAPDFDRYEAVFSQGGAEFHSTIRQFQSRLQIAVCPEDDMELRQLTLTNLSRRARTVEITSYAEVVLLDGRSEAAHPAFHKLFVQTDTARTRPSLLFTRRPRAAGETHPWMFHTMFVAGGTVLRGATFETDRAAFIGRGRSIRAPPPSTSPGPSPTAPGSCSIPPPPSATACASKPANPSASTPSSASPPRAKPPIPTWTAATTRAWPSASFRWHGPAARCSCTSCASTRPTSRTTAASPAPCSMPIPTGAGRASIIAANRRNQAALWSYGISGDRPIVLLSITDQANLDLVRNLVQAHTYWRQKGLEVDLVIWSEAYAGYRQNLLDAIIGLVQAGTEAKLLDQPGGIFVRNIDQVPEEDRILFRAVARIVLSDRHGTLAEQIDRRVIPESDIPELLPEAAPGEAGSAAAAPVPAARILQRARRIHPRRPRIHHPTGTRRLHPRAVGQRPGQSRLRHRHRRIRVGLHLEARTPTSSA
jgi:cyclic beta-1,2-glucan synthetase